MLALVCVAALTGCETPARRLDPKAVQTITPGVTTRQEVLQEFGAPFETISSGDRTLLFYRRGYLGRSNDYGPSTDSWLLVLSVLVGPDDRVLRKHYSSRKIDTYFGAGVVAVGTKVDDKIIAQIRPNVTTRRQAEGLLGEPCAETLSFGGELVVDWAYEDVRFVGTGRLKMLRLFFNNADVVVAVKTVDNR
jgi:outer membrane protein assembly factor BamE (lipoprotein component of BamABCDE complex)